MGAHRKPEPSTVQGTCVECGDRPQAPKGAGKFRAKCSPCYRGDGRHRPAAKVRLDRIRAFIRDHKATLSCVRCGESHPATLDFHHRDPAEKDFTLAEASKGWGIDRLKAEMAKCDVLCANCHRKEHWDGT